MESPFLPSTLARVLPAIATACFANRVCFFPVAAVALAIFAHRRFTPLSTDLRSVTPSQPATGNRAHRQPAAARSAVVQGEGTVVEVVVPSIVVVVVVELASSSAASAPVRKTSFG